MNCLTVHNDLRMLSISAWKYIKNHLSLYKIFNPFLLHDIKFETKKILSRGLEKKLPLPDVKWAEKYE